MKKPSIVYKQYTFACVGVVLSGLIFTASLAVAQSTPPKNRLKVQARLLEMMPSAARSDRSCSPIDLRGTLGRPRARVMNDHSFAIAAADLIESRTGVAVSSLDLATNFYFGDVKKAAAAPTKHFQIFLGKNPKFDMVIQSARRDSNRIRFSGDETESGGRKTMFHRLNGGSDYATLAMANIKDLCTETSLPSEKGLIPYTDTISELETRASLGYLKSAPLGMYFDESFRHPVADQFNSAWMRYVNRKCKRVPSPVAILPVEISEAQNIGQFRQEARKINSERLLAALNYALENQRVALIRNDHDRFRDWAAPSNVEYSNTVVARRMIDGSCHYLVRDISGFSCVEYESRFWKTCANHLMWVDESDLVETLYSVIFLK